MSPRPFFPALKISGFALLLALTLSGPVPLSAQDAPAAPTYPHDFVGCPEFTTTAGKQSAGTASVIKLSDGFQSYIVSARHLLGPEGGFAKQADAKDVPTFVQSIKIQGFTGGSRSYSVDGLLVPATQLEPIGGTPIDDLAIYQLKDSSPQDQAAPLAAKPPAVGETVWVVAEVRGGVPQGEIMHSAKVLDGDGWLRLQFDNDKIITNGASGAPVLNAAGEVVGVYSGHSEKDGHKIAFVIPAALILSVIQKSH